MTVILLTGPATAEPLPAPGWPQLAARNPLYQEELTPKLDLIPKDHPRIFIHGEPDLAVVRARIQADPNLKRVYGYLLDYARGNSYYGNLWIAPLQLQACVVAYRLDNTKDPKIKAHCLAIMEFLMSDRRADFWVWPRMAKGLAFAYDWLYDDLTPEERKRYGERAIYCAKKCYLTGRHTAFNNHLYLEYGPILYVGVALYKEGLEDDSVRQMALDGIEILYKHFIPTHEFVSRGDGGWQESMGYHAFFTYEFAQNLELWTSASGEDLWKDFKGLDHEADYQIYNLRPFDMRRVNIADSGDGDPVDSQILQYLPLVSRRKHDGLARYWSDWLVGQFEDRAQEDDYNWENRDSLMDSSKWWPYVLWYDPTVPEVKPETLPLARVFRGYGWVSMRSSWKPDATFATFVCSPTWYGGHQHCDNNSFVIHKYAPLALDSGVYDVRQGHRANYSARTIAHNTMLVYDPEEKCAGGMWGTFEFERVANDGGQVYMGEPYFPEDVGPGTWFDRSDLLAYEPTDDYVYTAGDATRAYLPEKLKEFTRAFLFLKPDIFVVFDRVESTRAELKKTWLLHSENEPQLAGSTFTIVNGPGKLWGQTLLPEKATFEPVGGPGKEFWVEGKNWPPRRVADDTGRWRLEVSPTQPALRDYFLHVLYATSSEDKTVPVTTMTQDANRVTATVAQGGKTWTVTFNKTGPLVGSLRITDQAGNVLVDRALAREVVLTNQQP